MMQECRRKPASLDGSATDTQRAPTICRALVPSCTCAPSIRPPGRMMRCLCFHMNGWTTTGIVGCCARTASGHAAAAPPSSVVNSRRLITRSPRRRVIAHIEAKRLGGLHVNNELELGRLHDRQIGRLLAFENAPRIDAGLPICLLDACAIAH